MGTSWLLTTPATTGTFDTEGVGGGAERSNGNLCMRARTPPITGTATAKTTGIRVLRRMANPQLFLTLRIANVATLVASPDHYSVRIATICPALHLVDRPTSSSVTGEATGGR